MTLIPHTTLVTTAELAAHLDDPTWAVFDCRHDLSEPGSGAEDYAHAHIPGARFMHLDRDLAAPVTGTNGRHPLPDAQAFMRRLGAAGIDSSKQVVAYDAKTGVYAARLWWMLRWVGHERVAVLDGGYAKWMREGHPLSAAVPQPVGGRIPGSINRCFRENLDSRACFKSAAELAGEFAALLGNAPPEAVVHSCGSGVTACHNLLAMEIAGLPGSRLYPGSWSEWCSDPGRPTEKG